VPHRIQQHKFDRAMFGTNQLNLLQKVLTPISDIIILGFPMKHLDDIHEAVEHTLDVGDIARRTASGRGFEIQFD
ncbi:uncharacterized protein METZ01_LOCUS140966, partial [marine metagenome]